jgi:hypothetical protein
MSKRLLDDSAPVSSEASDLTYFAFAATAARPTPKATA